MTFQHHDGSAEPARLPRSMSPSQEFLLLMETRKGIEQRLMELAETLAPGVAVAGLPASGLVQVSPGILLFKGGRDA